MVHNEVNKRARHTLRQKRKDTIKSKLRTI
jgi:hypothetical protein